MKGEREEPTMREKKDRTINVRLGVIDAILTTEQFTPQTALNLANLHLSCSSDLLLFNEDETRNGVQEWSSRQIADRFYQRRIAEETPLGIAHFRGDYRPLKVYLAQQGQESIYLSETEESKDIFETSVTNSMRAHGMTRKEAEEYIRESIRRNRRFGEQLLAMVGVIPDEGDPLIPPPPAWEVVS